jgi:hypothetical protein
MWTQIVGKVRLAAAPWANHSWNTTLCVTPRGLTTSPMPHGERTLQIEFVDHQLRITTCDAEERAVPLRPQATADFHAAVLAALGELKLEVRIQGKPNEVEEAIPFAKDRKHASYDADAVHRFWRALLQVDRVFKRFRARFIGKASPSHFFWGSFDLAITRFSGRTAPEHPGGYPNLRLEVMREAYSHEVSSAGSWPGGLPMPFSIFYSYAYPTPEGFDKQPVEPVAAEWNATLGEYVLPYEYVRSVSDPEETLLRFLQTTYEAAACCGKWDRKALERTFRPRAIARR